MKKIRLDKLLIIKGLVKSRSKAQYYIENKAVRVNGEIITKKSANFPEISEIIIEEEICPYVSFGGLKLEKAIEIFELDFNEKTVLDIGASTGGFTDCALKNGAKKVIAIDVGSNQLEKSLLDTKQVIAIDNFNLKDINEDSFNFDFDIVMTDVSFISLSHVFNVLDFCIKEKGLFVALIKPQFEVGPGKVKKGIVKSKKLHKYAIEKVIEYAESRNYNLVNITFSPITGSSGNIEYLGLFKKEGPSIETRYLDQVIDNAWKTL